MRYFIKVENGQAVGFPMQQDNFQEVYRDEDLDNLSPCFAEVIKAEKPQRTVYQVHNDPTYTLNSEGKMVESYTLSEVSEERKVELQNQAKASWAEFGDNFASWVFDATLCKYVSPVPYPTDGQNYWWNEADQTWELMPNG